MNPLRVVARLWWTAARRRWRQEILPFLLLAGVSGAHGFFTLRGDPAAPALYLTLLHLLALATALFLPMALHGASVLETRRFALLPHTPAHFFLLRLLLGEPLRVLLTLSAIGWTVMGLLRLPLPLLHVTLAVVQTIGWTLAAAVGVQIAGDALLRRRAITLHSLLAALGAGAGTLLFSYGSFFREIVRSGNDPGSGSALLLGSAAAAGAEALVAAAAMGASGGAILLAGRAAKRYSAPASPPRPPALVAALIARSAHAFAPAAPAAFAKELAAVLRHLRISSGLVWPFLFGILSFATGNPFLLLVPLLFWTLHTFNLLGMDVPLQGIARYHLLPLPITRVLAIRHAAFLLTITVAVVAAALVVGVVGAFKAPTVGPAHPVVYVIVHLYGSSFFLLAAVFGNSISIRYPVWYDLWRRQREGAATSTVPFLLSVTALGLLAAAVIFTAATVTGLAIRPRSEADWLTWVLLISTLLHVTLYALRTRSHAHGA